jgi:Serine dehydrogenase proteinase
MTTIQGSASKKLDLVLHSPGGSPEAAEGIVSYLRGKFTEEIRVIVPHLAMSAATMIACAANRVIMGRHSWLGTTDPQLPLQTPLGPRLVAAQATIEQFQRARQDCQSDAGLRAWAPILPQYGPDLLVLCENASALTSRLVKQWLRDYMFGELPRRERTARVNRLAGFLTDHSKQHTHGRHLDREGASRKGNGD